MAVIGRHNTSSNCYTTAWVVQDDANERFDLVLFALAKHYLNLKGDNGNERVEGHIAIDQEQVERE